MLSECLALFHAPRDWDAHKWEQQRASLETVLSLAAELLPRTCSRTLKGLLASSRVVGAELLAACKTLGIPKPLHKSSACEFGEEKAVARCSSIAAKSL